MGDGCRQSPAFDQQCYFNYCKSVMAAKCSLSFLLLTGNLAGQWLLFKWKSVDFDALRGTLPVKLVQVGQCGSVFPPPGGSGGGSAEACWEGGGAQVGLAGF